MPAKVKANANARNPQRKVVTDDKKDEQMYKEIIDFIKNEESNGKSVVLISTKKLDVLKHLVFEFSSKLGIISSMMTLEGKKTPMSLIIDAAKNVDNEEEIEKITTSSSVVELPNFLLKSVEFLSLYLQHEEKDAESCLRNSILCIEYQIDLLKNNKRFENEFVLLKG